MWPSCVSFTANPTNIRTLMIIPSINLVQYDRTYWISIYFSFIQGHSSWLLDLRIRCTIFTSGHVISYHNHRHLLVSIPRLFRVWFRLRISTAWLTDLDWWLVLVFEMHTVTSVSRRRALILLWLNFLAHISICPGGTVFLCFVSICSLNVFVLLDSAAVVIIFRWF